MRHQVVFFQNKKRTFCVYKILVLCVALGFPCVSFSAECPDGFDMLTNLPEDTFVAPVDNKCIFPGYSMMTIDETIFNPLFTGTLSGGTVNLCTGGHYVNGSCVDWEAGDCPAGHNDLELNDTTFITKTGEACGTGYTGYEVEDICSDASTAPICMIMSCDGVLTDNGECATACTQGATELKIRKDDSTVVSFPLWSAKLTTPAINIQFENGQMCYVNLVAGNGSDALNVTYDSMTYHTTN